MTTINPKSGTLKAQIKGSHQTGTVTQNQGHLDPILLQKTIPNELENFFSSFARLDTKLTSDDNYLSIVKDLSEYYLNATSQLKIIRDQLKEHETRLLSRQSILVTENLQLKAALQEAQERIALLKINPDYVADSVDTQDQDQETTVADEPGSVGTHDEDTGVSDDASAVDNKKSIRLPPGYWKKHYWTQEIQDLVNERDRCYRRWRYAVGIDKIPWWLKHKEAKANFRKAVQAAKRDAYKKYLSEISEL